MVISLKKVELLSEFDLIIKKYVSIMFKKEKTKAPYLGKNIKTR